MEDLECHKCGSDTYVKNGNKHGKQNYLCKKCGCQFTNDYSFSKRERDAAITLYCAGLSFRQIAELLLYSHVTILNWVRDFANKPLPDEEFLLDFDELTQVIKTKQMMIGKLEHVRETINWNADNQIDKLISKAFMFD